MKKTKQKVQYALVAGRLDRLGGLAALSFVPGDFSRATYWPVEATAEQLDLSRRRRTPWGPGTARLQRPA